MGKWLERLKSKVTEASSNAGSKGPKGGFEPFEPLASRPFPNYSRGTTPATDGRFSIVDAGQSTSPAEWIVLERWLQKLNPSDLPPEPFVLDAVTTVIDKKKYLNALKREAEATANGPRARLDALQAECRKLRAVLDTASENTSFSPRVCPPASTREGTLYIGLKSGALVSNRGFLKQISIVGKDMWNHGTRTQ